MKPDISTLYAEQGSSVENCHISIQLSFVTFK